jgi:multiple sugar transport system permease protein
LQLMKRKRRIATAFVLVLPCAILLILMMVYPTLQVFRFSFSSLKLPKFDATFVGLENFKGILSSKDFIKILINTCIWTGVSLLIRFIIGFAAALIAETHIAGMNVFRTVTLLPWMVPSIVSANTWRWLFNTDNGLVNTFLRYIDPSLSQNWLGSNQFALPSVIIAYSWAGFPFIMLMLIAAMQGIPKDYYEAGRIDGAGSFKLFRYITLPSLKNIVLILTIMEVISGFNSFDIIFTMTGGGPGIASEIFGLFIYRKAFSNLDFSESSAASMLLIIVALVLITFFVLASNKKKMKGGEY